MIQVRNVLPPEVRNILCQGALPHQNLPLFVSHYLFLSGFRRHCHEATSVPMTSGQTSTQALYS